MFGRQSLSLAASRNATTNVRETNKRPTIAHSKKVFMTRELRYNLIFFGSLIVLMSPGFVILMNKKLSGRSEPNYMPNPLPSSIAYMQPPPFSPRMQRVEPTQAREWVTQLLKNSSILARTPEDRPVMNDTSQVQLLARTPTGGTVLLWAPASLTQKPEVKIVDAPTSLTQSAELVDVPRPVRHAIQRAGYITPPFRLWLVAFEASPDARLTLSYVNVNDAAMVESVP